MSPSCWNGSPVPFNTAVNYTCDSGMRFNNDVTNYTVQVYCRPGNVWDTPTTWPTCVTGE